MVPDISQYEIGISSTKKSKKWEEESEEEQMQFIMKFIQDFLEDRPSNKHEDAMRLIFKGLSFRQVNRDLQDVDKKYQYKSGISPRDLSEYRKKFLQILKRLDLIRILEMLFKIQDKNDLSILQNPKAVIMPTSSPPSSSARPSPSSARPSQKVQAQEDGSITLEIKYNPTNTGKCDGCKFSRKIREIHLEDPCWNCCLRGVDMIPTIQKFGDYYTPVTKSSIRIN